MATKKRARREAAKDDSGNSIVPTAKYEIEASYPEGAFVGFSSHILGSKVEREKRVLKGLAEDGYRIKYHVRREK